MWVHIEIRVGRRWFRKYWSSHSFINRLRYRFDKEYRKAMDDIPF